LFIFIDDAARTLNCVQQKRHLASNIFCQLYTRSRKSNCTNVRFTYSWLRRDI